MRQLTWLLADVASLPPAAAQTYTEEKGYVTADVAEREGLHKLNLSGTKFRKMLRAGGLGWWCVWSGCGGGCSSVWLAGLLAGWGSR